MFSFVFYMFSLLLSYTDCKKFLVPNSILVAMFIMLLYTGWLENQISLGSFLMALLVLLFFIVLLLLQPKMILGGGDIKYMMIVAFYLPFLAFPLFLIVTGVLQTFALLYTQRIKKRRIVAMVPVMFASVIITQVIISLGYYKLV